MQQDLSNKLREKYPKILNNQSIDCGDGWYGIIDNLCGVIQRYVDGVTRYEDDKEVHCPQVYATQVKEKFAGLRFYYRGGDEAVEGMIYMAEWMAQHTCDRCGEPGKLKDIGDGVYATRCNQLHELPDIVDKENDDG